MEIDFLIWTFPESGDSSPIIIRRSVVYPIPFGPTKPTRMPCLRNRFTFEKRVLSGNDLDKFSTRIIMQLEEDINILE